MARNIEIKARVADLDAVETRARSMATEGPLDLRQDDTFFACAHGRLKLRQFEDGTAQLIHYERADSDGPKLSDYVIAPATNPEALREALARACGVLGRVRKQRRVYLVGRTRIHLDRVEGLGEFVELELVLGEAEPEQEGLTLAARLLEALGIDEAQRVRGAYFDHLMDSRRRQEAA